jgi:hypothetical protein
VIGRYGDRMAPEKRAKAPDLTVILPLRERRRLRDRERVPRDAARERIRADIDHVVERWHAGR